MAKVVVPVELEPIAKLVIVRDGNIITPEERRRLYREALANAENFDKNRPLNKSVLKEKY